MNRSGSCASTADDYSLERQREFHMRSIFHTLCVFHILQGKIFHCAVRRPGTPVRYIRGFYFCCVKIICEWGSFFILHFSFFIRVGARANTRFIYAAGIRYTGTVHPGVLLLLREKCLRICVHTTLPFSAGGHKCPPVQCVHRESQAIHLNDKAAPQRIL